MATPPVDGALTEYVLWPDDFVYPVPDSVSDDAAALLGGGVGAGRIQLEVATDRRTDGRGVVALDQVAVLAVEVHATARAAEADHRQAGLHGLHDHRGEGVLA
mgnify:CR=1 FL=1